MYVHLEYTCWLEARLEAPEHYGSFEYTMYVKVSKMSRIEPTSNMCHTGV